MNHPADMGERRKSASNGLFAPFYVKIYLSDDFISKRDLFEFILCSFSVNLWEGLRNERVAGLWACFKVDIW